MSTKSHQSQSGNTHTEDFVKSSSCCSSQKDSGHSHDSHNHDHGDPATIFKRGAVSFILLVIGLYWVYFQLPTWFEGWVKLSYFILAYIPVGIPVLKEAWHEILHGAFFSEFFLMGIATLGAFAIGEYPEAVAVMLFYTVGEGFQSLAVQRGQKNIQKLLDQRPDEATVIKNGKPEQIPSKNVEVGDVIQLKPGEKLGLDGELITTNASFDTRALTGESKPDSKTKGDMVYAGMINGNTPAQIKVTTAYKDSKLSQIIKLVGEASSQKAPTERFIQKFAKVYTPIVVYAAIAITFIPYLFVENYIFHDWLYRALIFLVISCPCALVISIPLGYFGGIGAASRNGILVKGGNYLDVLANLNHLVMDKTGTLTKGVFKVQKVVLKDNTDNDAVLNIVNALESHSSHPVATAIHDYVGDIDHSLQLENIEEIAGHGLKADYQGEQILVGNLKLMDLHQVSYDKNLNILTETVIAIAQNGKFKGYLTIADELKPEAPASIQALNKLKVRSTMLSGDKAAVVQETASKLGIKEAYGGLLPADKVDHVKKIKAAGDAVGFVGDGFNDAPVIALSDVGIAMGGLGSDAAIEIADVVIQDDNVRRLPMAIKIGKKTKVIIWQNIIMAFGIKLIVLIMGAFGIATMWEAVFADVGVALLAIANAYRIQKIDFER